LVQACIDYEFIDASGILFPALQKSDQPWAGLPTTLVENSEKLQQVCNRITNQDLVIFLGGVYPGQIEKPDSVYQALARTSAKLGAINVVHIPLHIQPDAPFHAKFIRRVRQSPIAWWEFLSQRFARQIIRMTVREHTLRSLDFVWAGTMVAPISSKIINTNTRIRYIHTYDYEDAKSCQLSSVDEKGYIVLLDSMGPAGPDHGVIGKKTYRMSEIEYYRELRAALATIADSASKEIIVAAHPRAKMGTLDSSLRPFKVKYGMTPELISQAKLVLDPSFSAGVSFAVMSRVPIVFLSSHQFGASVESGQKTLVNLLKTFKVSLCDVSKFDWNNLTVDTDSYVKYENTFIKREGSLEEPFWQQVIQDIRQAAGLNSP